MTLKKKLLLTVLFIILQLFILALPAPSPQKIYVKDGDLIDWTVARDYRSVDGCNTTRSIIVVYNTYDKNCICGNCTTLEPKDSSFPGPTLIMTPGQYVRILVRNNLDEPVALHWHGLHMKNTTYSDGITPITQCPIQSGLNFLYDFYANEEPEGLFGYIIIKENKENDDYYDVDLIDDNCIYCVLLSNLYRCSTGDELNYYRFCYVTTSLTPEPIPNTVLINGIGGRNEENGEICTNKPVDNIIEIEGMRVNTTNQIKLLPINVAQRYSVIATTNDTTTNNFWMRFQISVDCIRRNTPVDQMKSLIREIKAIVRYDKSEGRPNTTPWIQEIEKLPCIDIDYTLLLPADVSSKAPELEIDSKKNKSKTCQESTECQEYTFDVSMTTINSTKNLNENYATFGEVSLKLRQGYSVGIFYGTIFGYTENTLHYTMENLELFDIYGSYGQSIYPDPSLNVVVLDKTPDIIEVIII
ncbi:18635_t:CDS:2, partial [Racocetra fulgida]